MDVLLTILVVALVGSIKVFREGTVIEDSVKPVMQSDGSIVLPKSQRPVGDNLGLKREYGAFTMILKELNLD